MNHPQIDPLEAMQTAMQNADKANLRLFLALDTAVSMDLFKHGLIPTDVLRALDYARECAAATFVYLTAPVENAVEAGPAQDQTPEAAYQNGLLTVAEYDRLVAEDIAIQTTREATNNAAWLPVLMGAPDMFEK